MTEVESFRAVIMDQTLRHRGGDLNLVPQFITAVELELQRYADKKLDATTMDAINGIAARAVARARKLGRLEAFEAE